MPVGAVGGWGWKLGWNDVMMTTEALNTPHEAVIALGQGPETVSFNSPYGKIVSVNVAVLSLSLAYTAVASEDLL